jgi:hypothetical protein
MSEEMPLGLAVFLGCFFFLGLPLGLWLGSRECIRKSACEARRESRRVTIGPGSQFVVRGKGEVKP